MRVIVRTHGGLGNQIFQLFYARLFASQNRALLFEVHDLRYPLAFRRSEELSQNPAPHGVRKILSSLRLPKIMDRLKKGRNHVRIFDTVYLDGYFQRKEDYVAFSDKMIRDELLRLRSELGISSTPTRDHGVHLRMGDFFTTEATLMEHLTVRLARMRVGADIITNEETRLATPAVRAALAAVGAQVIPTGNMSAEDVLRTLATFKEVDGNDSTLLFWASVLSGMVCDFKTVELRDLRSRFSDALKY